MIKMCLSPDEFHTSPGISPTRADAFMVSASFEDRSVTIAKYLPEGVRYGTGLLYANEEFLCGEPSKRTKCNMVTLSDILHARCDKVEVAIGSWLDPAKQLKALRQLTRSVVSANGDIPLRIHVDATTFTRESLLVSCALFRQISASLRIYYTTPQSHGSWLTRGYRGVRNVMGFPGVQSPGAPMILIVLSGFEPDRILRFIEAYEPSKVILGLGNPPTAQDFLSRNVEDQKLVLSRQDVSTFNFPAASVLPCAEVIQAIIGACPNPSNIVLAPMSTKLSAIASLLVAEKNPAIQLAYCLPGEYNTGEYSEGARCVFIEDLPPI